MGDDLRTTRGRQAAQGTRAPSRLRLRSSAGYPSDEHPSAPRPTPAGQPHLTLPSSPALPRVRRGTLADSAGTAPRRGGLLSRVSRRLPTRRPAPDTWDAYPWDEPAEAFAPGDSSPRRREQTAARPLVRASEREAASDIGADYAQASYAPAKYIAPPLVDVPDSRPLPALRTDSVPDLVAYHERGFVARAPSHTRMLLREAGKKASSPWAVGRLMLALLAMTIALWVSLSAAGEPSAPALTFRATAGSSAASDVVNLVQPITQLLRCDEYDSYQQCQDYGDAACSAAAMTEVFTAWGLQHMTIGRMIDELGNDISPYGGLLTHAGFQRVAALHGYRADIRNNLTYDQMLYIVNTLGIPLIVDVRISYGYYHFLAGGHFLVMTGGNEQGVRIVDSSEYYIHSLPRDVFNSMFTGGTALLVPATYQYSLP